MANDAIHANPTHPFEVKFDHAAISVPDLESSIAWYGTMLGFELEGRATLPQVRAKLAFLRRGNLRVELFEVPGAAALPEGRRVPDDDVCTHGNKHVCYAVKDARAVTDELKSRGADIVFIKEMPQATVVYIRDNAGNLIELVQRAEPW